MFFNNFFFKIYHYFIVPVEKLETSIPAKTPIRYILEEYQYQYKIDSL